MTGAATKVAVYARVSKDGGRQMPENQLLDLRKFVTAMDWPVAVEFVDLDSGGKSDRPNSWP